MQEEILNEINQEQISCKNLFVFNWLGAVREGMIFLFRINGNDIRQHFSACIIFDVLATGAYIAALFHCLIVFD